MVCHKNLETTYIEPIDITYESDSSLTERPQLAQLRQTVEVLVVGESEVAQLEGGSDVEELTAGEADLLQAELLRSIAVRSKRQPQRKSRQARAAKKTSATVVSVNSGSTSPTKCGLQETDHSDPLRYLRQTSSSSKLLTATEEQELSEGIQVYFNFLIFATLFRTLTYSYQSSQLIYHRHNLITNDLFFGGNRVLAIFAKALPLLKFLFL